MPPCGYYLLRLKAYPHLVCSRRGVMVHPLLIYRHQRRMTELCTTLPSGIYLSALFSSFQACILAQGIVPAAGCCVGVGSRHVGTVFFCSFWFHHIYTIIMTEYGTSLSRCMSLRRVFFITYLMCALRRVSLGTGHIPVYLHKQYLFCGCNRAVAQSSGLQQDVRWGSAAQFFHPFHRRKIPRH